MRLSKRAEYGVKAAVRLCQTQRSAYTQSREIAESEGLPAKFLESILLTLRSASILESKVGAGGGYRLARTPQTILVKDVLAAFDAEDDESPAAASSNGSVGRAALDALHERIEGAIESAVGGLTLAELAAAGAERRGTSQNAMYFI